MSSLLVSSCSVTPPDVPLCTEINPSRGYCVNTLSNKKYEINDTQKLEDKTWWEAKPYMIYMPVSSWVEIKSFMIKICKISKMCNVDISSWNRGDSK